MAAPAPNDLLGRKARGAFFTPPAIAHFLTDSAMARNPQARVLDPTCGDGVFLLAAGKRLRALGASPAAIRKQLTGVDVRSTSLDQAGSYLHEDKLDATLVQSNFFNVLTPAQLGARIGWQDAVVGNPPFVRYQEYGVQARKLAASAALGQGVRLYGLASSWAPLLVHAGGFLKPEGRLAMVVPAELLTARMPNHFAAEDGQPHRHVGRPAACCSGAEYEYVTVTPSSSVVPSINSTRPINETSPAFTRSSIFMVCSPVVTMYSRSAWFAISTSAAVTVKLC